MNIVANPTVHETAILLDGTDAWVRNACQRHILGDAWSSGRQRYTYIIIPAKVAQFMGITEDEVLFRLRKIREENNGLY